jgi:hypothetical protein
MIKSGLKRLTGGSGHGIYGILKRTGWTLSHVIQAPLSSERFNAGVVAAMQQKRSLGLSAGM